MIDVIKNMPNVEIKIIESGNIIKTTSLDIGMQKKIIIFGVPGAFTSTCSMKHLPSFINLADDLKNKGIEKIYCLSVNDPFVMKSWQEQYENGYKINMIADGNADLTKALELDQDYSSSFMGLRSKRFAMIAENNKIISLNIEEKGKFKISSAEHIINQL